MSSNNNNCGCIIIAVVLGVGSIISSCKDKHSSAPTVSQPATGYVAPAPTRENSSPTVAEPYGTLQTGGFGRTVSALKLTNSMSNPAYVKIYDSSHSVCATLYLRAGESYELGVDPGSYLIKYVSGPSNEWRGTTHYFGSRSNFHSENSPTYIGANQKLTVTFVTRYSRYGGSNGSLRKIGEDEF